MKLRELLTFSPVTERIRLGDPGRAEGAAPLVSEYRISPATAGELTARILPALDLDQPDRASALLLDGPAGSGRSHLLAVLAAVAERGEPAPPPPVSAAPLWAVVAGRFRVVRVELDGAGPPLRTRVLRALADALVAAGAERPVGRETPTAEEGASLDALLAAWPRVSPDLGLLLLLDDLGGGQPPRRRRERERDRAFLERLGAAGRGPCFRVVAALGSTRGEEWRGESSGATAGTAPSSWLPVTMSRGEWQFVAKQRLTGKTPENRRRVEAHLARFTPCYPGMQERLAEFVDSYPLHPDVLTRLAESAWVRRRGALPLLSALLASRLEEEWCEDEPGAIGSDALWPLLCDQPEWRSEHEPAAVISFTRQLEADLARGTATTENRPLARRIIRALAVGRLLASDVYRDAGVSAADLRDGLALYRPGCDTADALLAAVQETLAALPEEVGGSVVTLRRDDDRVDLHFRKFRRFSTPELILHWVNAVPFLALMTTGAVMLGSRFGQLDRQLFSATVTLHKLSALTWGCALPLSVLGRLRPHLANFRTLLTWGPDDAAWLIQSVRSLYHPAAVVPPADRFNTGQKINSCLVVVYYFGFLATGLLMFAKGTILFPWYVHTALFFSAAGSVGGHLYLAFLNPSTRIALGGIFHGWVPLKYVAHHHALSLPAARPEPAESANLRQVAWQMLRSKVEVAVLALTVVLAGAGAYAFGQGRLAAAKRQFAESFADVIQPSQLNTAHRLGPAADSCTQCHSYTGEIPDRKCEACHKDVRDRRAEQLGFHGTLGGDCRSCHREHRAASAPLVPLVQAEFDHDQALFPLEGRHAAVNCDECHRARRDATTPGIYYLGLKSARCAECHADPHGRQFMRNCESCHTPAGWTGPALKFRHETGSDFSLVGRHGAVECRKCHQSPDPAQPLAAAMFRGLARDCAGCHADPHRQQFGARCTDCHTPAGWRGRELQFVHDRDSRFPLRAKHAVVDCEKCHRPPSAGAPLGRAQFCGLNSGCADCHQDPHRGQLARDCTQCHPRPDTWRVSAPQFVHDRDTAFPLVGGHATVDCRWCHQPRGGGAALASAQFKGLASGCASCHAVQHPDGYGSTCAACHTPMGPWPPPPPAFDHWRATGFELAGRHLVAKCHTCHRETVLGAVDPTRRGTFRCITCHQKDEPHQGSLGQDCQKCHSHVGWKGDDLIFEHNTMASFALNADHVNVSCRQCHKNGNWKPLDAACVSCHPRFIAQEGPAARGVLRR